MTLPLPPDAPTSAWRVTGQQETLRPGPGGQVAEGVVVSFTTAKGVQSSVFIPKAMYSPQNVRAAIAAQAHQLDQVQELKG